VDELSRILGAYDRGTISRRRLLQALGVAGVGAAGVALPAARLFGQGQCAGRDKDTTAVCNKTLAKAPFKPTGWKTVLLDHFTMQVTDPEQEAAFYTALMSWKVRSNDSNGIMMDIGNWGGVRIRGGYTPPPRAARGAGRGGAGGAGGAGGRGGRGGAPGGAQARPDYNHLPECTVPKVPRISGAGADWDGFAWGISDWNTKKVEAALKERGLNPVADNGPDGYESFLVKDPDGLNVWITNGNKKNRRTTPANGKLNVQLPFAPTGWQTKYLDHISFGVPDYKATVAWYSALLGWKGLGDEGSQDETEIAPDIGGLLIRGPNSLAPGFVMPNPRHASMGHISFGIADFDPDKVYAALCERGLSIQPDTGAIDSSPPVEKNIHTATYKSYHTETPNNFNLQISNKITPTQPVGAPGTSGAKPGGGR
jgi:catechol 2,3-dioxygenase-like lactoylglutathione lyase family enzyme